ncbi:hypothetical protein BaRGS_00005051 [Batillaria attramentaria]|uniref:Uncharacterized protein n=1 Tax=Batillaria attramentaria TaxID=370345 RepID=A0ABD0LVV9_9CAEN
MYRKKTGSAKSTSADSGDAPQPTKAQEGQLLKQAAVTLQPSLQKASSPPDAMQQPQKKQSTKQSATSKSTAPPPPPPAPYPASEETSSSKPSPQGTATQHTPQPPPAPAVKAAHPPPPPPPQAQTSKAYSAPGDSALPPQDSSRRLISAEDLILSKRNLKRVNRKDVFEPGKFSLWKHKKSLFCLSPVSLYQVEFVTSFASSVPFLWTVVKV